MMSIVGTPYGDFCGTCGQPLDACVCFVDDSYTCRLCGYNTDSEEDFVEHILDEHEAEARKSKAVKITPITGVRDEHWSVNSIALAEEFDAN